MTTLEAAELLGVSDRRVRAMISSGILKARRYGKRKLFIDPEDARTLKKQHRAPGRPRKERSENGKGASSCEDLLA